MVPRGQIALYGGFCDLSRIPDAEAALQSGGGREDTFFILEVIGSCQVVAVPV